MQIGVSSYSFLSYMKQTGATAFDMMDKAKELGYTSMEWISVYAPDGTDSCEQAKKIRAYAEQIGLTLSAYTIGADFLKNGEEEQFDMLKQEIAIAEALGVPRMRHDITQGFPATLKTGRGFAECAAIVAPRIRRVSEYAREHGIFTMFENHGFFCQDSARVEMLLNAVHCDNFGLLLDVGNFACVDEDSAMAVGKLAPYAVHVHLKDFFKRSGDRSDPGAGWFRSRAGNYLRGTIVGQGDIPVFRCMQTLLKSGYSGTFSVEFEGIEDNLFALRTGLDNINRMFPGTK